MLPNGYTLQLDVDDFPSEKMLCTRLLALGIRANDVEIACVMYRDLRREDMDRAWTSEVDYAHA